MKLKKLYLSQEQLDDEGFVKVNLACGRRLYPGWGWVNLDLNDISGVEYCDIWRLTWPVKPATVDYILCSHILEHVPHWHPKFQGEYWYHFFPFLLSRMADGGLIEVWGPDPDRRNTLQYVGHTRLVGPMSFAEYTQPAAAFSSGENLDSRNKYDLELVHMEKKKGIRVGPINDYHFIKYLGERWRDRVSKVVGHPDEIRMVFKVKVVDH
jgi:hypothetical protein